MYLVINILIKACFCQCFVLESEQITPNCFEEIHTALDSIEAISFHITLESYTRYTIKLYRSGSLSYQLTATIWWNGYNRIGV